MTQTHSSLCRVCPQGCALRVDVDNGRATKITGDKSNPLCRGYICVKGSAQVEMLRSPDRLLSSYKRLDNGTLQKISVEQALDEIADKLRVIAPKMPSNSYFHDYTNNLGAGYGTLQSYAQYAPALVDRPDLSADHLG